MSRIADLRAEAQKLYEQALKIKDGDERLALILRAMELDTEADVLERRLPEPAPGRPAAEQPAMQQQQQPQAKDDSEAE
jgi:hypothetical protein